MSAAASSARLTWVGHATTLLDVGGVRILTDPLLRQRVAHLKRHGPPPPPVAVDLVLLSHAHMDHLHVPSLRRIDPGVPIVSPRGTANLLSKAGHTEIIEVDVGDRVDVAGAEVSVTPAMHKTGRGMHSRNASDPLGFVIDVDGHRTYFAGDTDLFDGMADLGDIDLALLPIWGWGPTIGIGHLDPERAVEATSIIRPGLVVPVHWGTFAPENLRRSPPAWLSTPAAQFEAALAAHDDDLRALVLPPGASIDLDETDGSFADDPDDPDESDDP